MLLHSNFMQSCILSNRMCPKNHLLKCISQTLCNVHSIQQCHDALILAGTESCQGDRDLCGICCASEKCKVFVHLFISQFLHSESLTSVRPVGLFFEVTFWMLNFYHVWGLHPSASLSQLSPPLRLLLALPLTQNELKRYKCMALLA